MGLPELIIFDLDGTLVDSVPDLALAVNASLQELNMEIVSEQQVSQWVGNGSVKLIECVLKHHECFSEALLSTLHVLFLKHYKNYLNQASQLYPGVENLLHTLKSKNIKLAICTNKPKQFLPPLLKQFGINEMFELVIGGDSLTEKKPSPLPLQFIMSELQCKPKNTWMVGDSRADALSAQAAEVDCILLEQGYSQGVNLSELPHKMVCRNIQSFAKVLEDFQMLVDA